VQVQVDFSFEEGVEELLKIAPDLDGDGNITEADKALMMKVIIAKKYLFIQSEPEFHNEQGKGEILPVSQLFCKPNKYNIRALLRPYVTPPSSLSPLHTTI
jgi:hypothetical protein